MKNHISNESPESKPMTTSSNKVIVEEKKLLTSARDLRDSIASLAMALADQAVKPGYLLVLETKLSMPFVQDEFRRFKTALRPDIAKRLRIIFAQHGDVPPDTEDIPQKDLEHLRHLITDEQKSGTPLNPPNKKDEVLLLLIHQWVSGEGNITSKCLEDKVGCSYRTVANAIDEMEHAVHRHSDRSVSLKHFPQQDWGRLLAVANRTRSTMLYADLSDQPRSYDSLLQRLWRLNLKHIAVGGVLGTKRYYDDLDIVGMPRLDLCIHAPGKSVDLEFMRALDPALERTRDTHRPAQVALHFIRRKDALFEIGADGSLWADPVECLLNLYNARLEQQARRFQVFLMARESALNGQ